MSEKDHWINAYLDRITRETLEATASLIQYPCDNTPTEILPDDIYNSSEELQIMCYGRVLTMEEKDNIVKRQFKKEFWPDRLKEKDGE